MGSNTALVLLALLFVGLLMYAVCRNYVKYGRAFRSCGVEGFSNGYYTITWDPPSNNGGDPNCCTYQWVVTDTSGTPIQSGVSSSPYAYFTAGDFNTSYTISVSAGNSAGWSSPSTFSLTTCPGPPTITSVGMPIIQTGSDTSPLTISLTGTGLDALSTYVDNGSSVTLGGTPYTPTVSYSISNSNLTLSLPSSAPSTFNIGDSVKVNGTITNECGSSTVSATATVAPPNPPAVDTSTLMVQYTSNPGCTSCASGQTCQGASCVYGCTCSYGQMCLNGVCSPPVSGNIPVENATYNSGYTCPPGWALQGSKCVGPTCTVSTQCAAGSGWYDAACTSGQCVADPNTNGTVNTLWSWQPVTYSYGQVGYMYSLSSGGTIVASGSTMSPQFSTTAQAGWDYTLSLYTVSTTGSSTSSISFTLPSLTTLTASISDNNAAPLHDGSSTSPLTLTIGTASSPNPLITGTASAVIGGVTYPYTIGNFFNSGSNVQGPLLSNAPGLPSTFSTGDTITVQGFLADGSPLAQPFSVTATVAAVTTSGVSDIASIYDLGSPPTSCSGCNSNQTCSGGYCMYSCNPTCGSGTYCVGPNTCR